MPQLQTISRTAGFTRPFDRAARPGAQKSLRATPFGLRVIIPFGCGEGTGKHAGGHFGWVIVRDRDVWRVTMLTAHVNPPK